ncbi:MAG: hypothetical protein IJ133_05685 [Clostridia bacterium]|nr:hypothetical protein [Clostridia bacterium]
MKQSMRSITSVLLALAMLATLLSTAAFAATPLGTAVPEQKVVTLHYDVDGNDVEGKILYSDSYFNRSGYEYRQALTDASLGMAWASGSSADAVKAHDFAAEPNNWKEFAESCGFTNIDHNKWLGALPEANSMGVQTASKTVKDKNGEATLIAVGCRGFGYRAEWGGNFNIGPEGEHRGFAIGRDETLQHLKEYIEKYHITGRIKVWLSGYSRGGSVSNMAAGALDDGYDLGPNVTLSRDDIYAYPFEAPKGVMKENAMDKKYDNIHNIINSADLVPTVAFAQWGFCRYGIDHIVPARSSAEYKDYHDNMAAMLSTVPYEEGAKGKYGPDTFQAYGIDRKDIEARNFSKIVKNDTTIEQFLYNVSEALTTVFTTSRQDYYENLEQGFVEALVLYGRTDDYEIKDALNLFTQKLQSHGPQLFQYLILDSDKATDLILDDATAAFRETNMTGMTTAQLKKLLSEVVPRLAKMAAVYPGTTLTLLMNINMVAMDHYSAPVWSWISTLPVDYLATHTAYSWQDAK